MLSSSVSAASSTDDQAVLSKARSTAFHALSQLRKDLRAAASPAAMAAEPRGPKWIDAARVALEAAVTSRTLLPAAALRCWLSWCLASCFSFPAISHHLYGTVKALHQQLVTKGVPSLTRTAVASALGALMRQHGAKVASCALESMQCLAKQLPLRELALREAAAEALVAVVEGTQPTALPEACVAEALKAVYSASKDKAPEVRSASARALRSLARCCPGGVTTEKPADAAKSGAVALEATLTLCVKGLDDGSIAVQLAFADAIAEVRSQAIRAAAAA